MTYVEPENPRPVVVPVKRGPRCRKCLRELKQQECIDMGYCEYCHAWIAKYRSINNGGTYNG